MVAGDEKMENKICTTTLGLFVTVKSKVIKNATAS